MSTDSTTALARVLRLLALGLVVLVLGMAVTGLGDALRLEGTPVPLVPVGEGGTVLPTVIVPVRFQAELGRISALDRIVAIDGTPWRSAADLLAAALRAGDGGTLDLEIERPGGRRFHERLAVVAFNRTDLREMLFLPLGLGLIFVGLVLTAVLLKPLDERAWAGFLFATGGTLNYVALVVDAGWVHRFAPVSFMFGFVSAAGLIHLSMLQPERRWLLARHPRGGLVLIYATAGVAWALYALTNSSRPGWSPVLDLVEVGGFVLGLALHLTNLALTLGRSTNAQRLQEARVVLLGPALYVPFAILLTLQSFGWIEPRLPYPIFLAPLLATTLCFGWAVFGTNLFELDATLRRGMGLALVVLAAGVVWIGLFAAVQATVGAEAGWAAALLAGVVVIGLVPSVGGLRGPAERLVEGALFPRHRVARETLEAAARELPRLRGEAELAALLRGALARGLTSTSVRLLAGVPGESLHEFGVDEGGSASRLSLPPTDSLAAAIARGALLRRPGRSTDAKPRPGNAAARRVADLGVDLVVPLPPGPRVVGAVLLGPRADGRLYTADDEALVEAVVAQCAVAMENAHVWDEVRRLESRINAENLYLREELAKEVGAGEIVGDSLPIRSVRAQIAQVAPTDASVLVVGETGTGKELVVRALHAASRRAAHGLVKVACAAIPETLLESDLFGHERGAFTGATARKLGRFEVADGGTVFFDDVDTLPLGVQAKLLRAIQEGEIQRLGSNQLRRVDVRIIAATNRDLLAEVRAGRFREDLYYRLNVVPIVLPPLRGRPGDVRLLVDHIVRREALNLGREIREISAEALAEMEAYSWPGNVRELRNVLERAIVMASDHVLRLTGPLATGLAGSRVREGGGGELGSAPLADLVRGYKVRLVSRALELSGGNQRAAAELLGMHRPSLTRMIGELGLREPATGPDREAGGGVARASGAPRRTTDD